MATRSAIPQRVMMKAGQYIKEYCIKSTLGEGTFGVVYEVSLHGKSYALKLLKLWEVPYDKEREKIVERFDREFECGQVSSKHLVQSVAKGIHLGNPYIVMEFCPNGTLSKYIHDLPSFDIINKVTCQILKGLSDLHKNGIFHRDIKPDNILFGTNDVVKLTDFGIAGFKQQRMTERNILGRSKNVFGTYAYIAPEQLDRRTSFKAMSAVTDIFSFGVTMYEIFSGGKLPFGTLNTETDLANYMQRAREGKWVNIQQYNPSIPSYWVDIIGRCLHPDYKNERYDNIDNLISQLGCHIQAHPSQKSDTPSGAMTLEVMHGEEKGRVYNLSELLNTKEGILRLGWLDTNSPNNNDIGIKETMTSYISSRHATIEKISQPKIQWFIRDGQWREKQGKWGWYKSTNGVTVNSQKIDELGVELKSNDILIIGDTTLKINQV